MLSAALMSRSIWVRIQQAMEKGYSYLVRLLHLPSKNLLNVPEATHAKFADQGPLFT